MLAIFSVLPMFNRQALPGMLRMGVAGGLALFLVPGLIVADSTEIVEVRADGPTLLVGVVLWSRP